MSVFVGEHQTVKRIRWAVFSCYFIQGLFFSSWASRIPDIKSSLGFDDAAWGSVLLMIPLGQIIGMTLSGFTVTRFGSKNIYRFVIIAYGLALITIGLATNKLMLSSNLIVFGFFGNVCNIAVNTQGVNVESMYNKPIMASFHGGWSLAGLTGGSIGLGMTFLKVPPVFHFLIIFILSIFILSINFKHLQPDIKKFVSKTDPVYGKNKPEKFLFFLGIVAFCGMAAEGAMADWSGLYIRDVVGMAGYLAPLGLTVYMVTMASGRFMVDSITQKFGRKRVLQGGGLLIFSGLSLAVIFPHPVFTLLSFMIIGFGTAGIIPTVYSVAGKKTTIPTGLALTIVSSIGFLGFLMGPPLIGYISHASSLRISYALIGLFGICIIILSSHIKILKHTVK